ncbi:Serine/threonine-protein kinase [Hordeum vulgare]|nr:Serine/threonine-protein kinase [Hordeum vulgare]
MALPAADNDNRGLFTMHHVVDSHVSGKDRSVVYTNEPVSVEVSIQIMEQLLAEDKYQVVGFDLEFTSSHAGQDYLVAIVQLCVQHDVVVYHYHLATRPCDRFARFINNSDYSFATVDTTNDLKALNVLGLTCQNLVNIRDHYKVSCITNNKHNSLVDLASSIIDP